MKRIIIGAMAAAALLACSKDQVIEQNRANDEIAFSVVADNQTKAEAVYCANNLLPAFDVAATYSDGTNTSWYFQNDHIVYQNSAWENTTTTRYWSTGTHDFYAIYNGKMNLSAIGDAPAVPTVNFTPETTVAAQKDLLYAVTKGHVKSNAPVALNFRHALSQIEFKAKNTNQQLYVKITGVRVGQTPGVGVFTYPSDDTDDNFVDHTQGTTHTYVTGSWTSTTPTDYEVEFTAVNVPGNNTPVGLTLSSDKDNVTNSMLLIPATTDKWVPTPGENTYNGTYLAVNCEIYNVAGTAYAPETDVCLHNGWAVMPVDFAWEPGKKYIYTFIFGEGNGGYDGGNDPDPDPTPDPTDPENPRPVLTPISYTVTVDDFQKGVDSDVTMKY